MLCILNVVAQLLQSVSGLAGCCCLLGHITSQLCGFCAHSCRYQRCQSSSAPCATGFTPCKRDWPSTWRPTAQRSRTCVIRSDNQDRTIQEHLKNTNIWEKNLLFIFINKSIIIYILSGYQQLVPCHCVWEVTNTGEMLSPFPPWQTM